MTDQSTSTILPYVDTKEGRIEKGVVLSSHQGLLTVAGVVKEPGEDGAELILPDVPNSTYTKFLTVYEIEQDWVILQPAPSSVAHLEQAMSERFRASSAKTLRDEFAMAAVTHALGTVRGDHHGWATAAAHAYEVADAMMKAREIPPTANNTATDPWGRPATDDALRPRA